MDNIQIVNLDILNNKTYEYIYTKQFDTGRTVIFNIKENSAIKDINGTECLFTMAKPDGYAVIKTLPITDNQATLVLDTDCTSEIGKLSYQLSFLSEGKVISTVTGIIVCEKAPVNNEMVTSPHSRNLIKDLAYLYENNLFDLKNVVLLADGWENNQQTVEVDGVVPIEDKQLIVVRPNSASAEMYVECAVICLIQGDGFLTFSCNEVPTEDLQVYVMTQGINSRIDNPLGIVYSETEPSPFDLNEHDIWIQPYT